MLISSSSAIGDEAAISSILVYEHDILHCRFVNEVLGHILAHFPVAVIDDGQVAETVGLEAENYEGSDGGETPLSQFRQADIGDGFALEEDNQGGNHDDHILQEGLFVAEFHGFAEATAVTHHTEIIAVVHFQMLIFILPVL